MEEKSSSSLTANGDGEGITSKVWIRSETVKQAAASGDANGEGSATAAGRHKPWSWTLARLVSGTLDDDSGESGEKSGSGAGGGVVVTIDDESSAYNGKTLDVSNDLLYSAPRSSLSSSVKGGAKGGFKSSLTKSAVAPPAGRRFGTPAAAGGISASFTGVGAKSSSSVGSSASGSGSGSGGGAPTKVCNIVMANPSDGYFEPVAEHSLKEVDEEAPEIKDSIDHAIKMARLNSMQSEASKNQDNVPPHDLQSLPHLHEPSVVHTLERRYDRDWIYTSTGNQILVALNPFKAVTIENEGGKLNGEDLYGDKVLDGYASLGEWEARHGALETVRKMSGGRDDLPEALPPHVFRVSDTAFRTMMSSIKANRVSGAGLGILSPLGEDKTGNGSTGTLLNANQSLLVSGESGAGKTVTTKHVLRYLASLSQRRGGTDMGKIWRETGGFGVGKSFKGSATAGTADAGGRGGKALQRPSLRNIVKAPSTFGGLGGGMPMQRGSLIRRESVRRGSKFAPDLGGGAIGMDGVGRPSMGRQPSWILGSQIEVQILEANPILESFGNARTVRNDNSSRFGKYIELQFKSTGSLIGASIETYLLEKVRLIHTEKGERNYHIFYELMEGASEEEFKEYLLEGYTTDDFKVINQSGVMDRRDGVDDQEEFDGLIESMTLLQFDPMHIKNIMRVTVACMHALNMTFTAPTSDESDLDDSNPHLQPFLTLLGIDRTTLRDTLCSYEILIGGRDKQRKNQTKDNAEKGMEAFIKAIYSAMFDHLVDHINKRIGYKPKDDGGNDHAASIGILDIFGFESFERNSFEQLCINYCNEALQQQFNGVIFKSQKEEYDREGIDSSFIKFPDNQDAIDLIDKGVLATLDDMSFAPAASDDKYAKLLYQKMDQSPSPRFEVSPLQKGKQLFVVNHYAGPVEYSIESFVEKNKEEIPRATADLLKSSSNEFVNLLADFLSNKDSADAAGGVNRSVRGGGKKKQNTVAKHFTTQLKQLRTKISQTTPYFVRCIKPNQELTPDNFNHDVVIDQLKSLGVLEAVRVSRMGFPKSYFHSQFVHRYRCLAMEQLRAVSGSDSKEMCKIVVNESLPHLKSFMDSDEGEKGFQIGETKVFLRPRNSDGLEWLRNKIMEDAATTIQKAARVKLARNRLDILKKEAYIIKIQSQMRRFLATRDVQIMMLELYSAIMIQKHQRGATQRAIFKVKLEEKREADRLAREAAERKRKEEEAAAKAAAEAEAAEVARRKAEEEAAAEEAKKAEERAAAAAAKKKAEEEEAAAAKKKKEAEEAAVALASMSIKEEEDTEAETGDSFGEEDDVVVDLKTRPTIANAPLTNVSARIDTSQMEEQDSVGRDIAASTAPAMSRGKSSRLHFFGKSKIQQSVRALGRRRNARASRDSQDSQENQAPPIEQTQKGMYEAILPITEHGLLINITSFHGGVAFASYRLLPDGSAGPAQQENLIHGVGDKIISVNGEFCDGKPFGEIVGMLVKASASQKGFCKLELQEWMHAYSNL